MSGAVRMLPHYTYAEYAQWEGQWELIEGIPYAMSPLPVPDHQRIAANLLIEFGLPLKNCKQCTVYQPIDYHLADDTILQPDMLVVCGEIVKKYLDFPPALVVEILSPSTMLKDRHIKFPLYEAQRVKYYLIISPDKEEIECYEYQHDAYQLIKKARNFVHEFDFGSCKATIDFGEIW